MDRCPAGDAGQGMVLRNWHIDHLGRDDERIENGIRSDMNISRPAVRSNLIPFTLLFLALAATGASAGAAENRVRSPADSPSTREKPNQPKTAATFGGLKSIGDQIARAMTQKKFEQVYPFLCASDKTRTTATAFGSMLRELHKASETTTVDLAKDDEIVRENRRAGAQTIADLGGLSTVMLPFRLHAPGHSGGDSTTVQVWVFHRESDSWCTPLDD